MRFLLKGRVQWKVLVLKSSPACDIFDILKTEDAKGILEDMLSRNDLWFLTEFGVYHDIHDELQHMNQGNKTYHIFLLFFGRRSGNPQKVILTNLVN
jgi:hypothetical protein